MKKITILMKITNIFKLDYFLNNKHNKILTPKTSLKNFFKESLKNNNPSINCTTKKIQEMKASLIKNN